MTLKAIKAEIREEFEQLGEGRVRFIGTRQEFRDWLNTALDRVAEATKEAIVPEERMVHGGESSETWKWGKEEWNSCRAQALENYEQFTKEV